VTIALPLYISATGLYIILPPGSHSHGGFHPSTAVKILHLPQEFVPRITPTLQELVGKEQLESYLSAMHSISLEDLRSLRLVEEAMRQFIAARKFSTRPIIISQWTRQVEWLAIVDIDDG
jgi:hypothetical protein